MPPGSRPDAEQAGQADRELHDEPEHEAVERQVDAVLAWLEANGFLSEARFVESRVHAREARFGNLRIRHELAQHGVAVSGEVERSLHESELERARAVCARKFAVWPGTAQERARAARFLAARGFSAETVRQVLRKTRRAESDDDAAPGPLVD
nr:regulatory protein RecX [Schlegelella koreensis]